MSVIDRQGISGAFAHKPGESRYAIGDELPTARAREHDINVGSGERIASLAAGIPLAAYGLFRAQRGRLSLAALGAGLVLRAVTGRCGVYRVLGASTNGQSSGPRTVIPAKQGVHVRKSVTINRPASDLYRVWRDLANLPQVMQHLVRIEVLDSQRSHWVAEGAVGRQVEWDAEVFIERENEAFAWRSLPGGDVDTTGSVHFKSLSHDRGTEVVVTLKYDPPGGKLGAWVATLAGDDLEQQIADDLRQFKQFMEAGEMPVAGPAPSGSESKHSAHMQLGGSP